MEPQQGAQEAAGTQAAACGTREGLVRERLYRVFCGLILAVVILPLFFLLLPIIVPVSEKLGIPFWLSGSVVYLGLLYYCCRSVMRKDKVSEPRRSARFQSLLIWLSAVMIVFSVCRFFFCWSGKFLYLFGVNTDYLLFPVLLILAVFCVVLRPFPRHEQGLVFGITGLAAGLLLCTQYSVGVVSYDYEGKHLPLGYVMPEKMQSRFFPPNASDFKIEGSSGFFAKSVSWSCRASEEDFESFRRENGYRFVQDRSDVNEDPEVQLSPAGSSWKKPYYFHRNIHRNGGGLQLRYSVGEQRLYGRYANR